MEDDAGRRFYFAWAHDRAKDSDTGEWYWGGTFCIPHEVAGFKQRLVFLWQPYIQFSILCHSHFMGNAEGSAPIPLEFDMAMQRVSLLNLPMGVDPFWVESCQAVPKATDPGPDGVRVCEKTFAIENGQEIDIKIIVDHDMIEVFVGEQVAFTYRIYAKPLYEVGHPLASLSDFSSTPK